MPTTKKRINISLSKEIENIITNLAKRDQVPAATKVGELVRLALEIEEDQALDQIAKERDVESVKFVSHEDAWT